jgi:hypothetical protein
MLALSSGSLGVVAQTGHELDNLDLATLRQRAEAGNAMAQDELGNRYSNGAGVPLDNGLAAIWLRKAADQGLASGEADLGAMYSNGDGVPQDYVKAAYWYRKAADQGFVDAQFLLGMSFEKGKGVPVDLDQARIWLQLAANGGEHYAKKELARLGDPTPSPVTAQVFQMQKNSTKMDADDSDVSAMRQRVNQAHGDSLPELRSGSDIEKTCAKGKGWSSEGPSEVCRYAASGRFGPAVQERTLLKGCSYETSESSGNSACMSLASFYRRAGRYIETLAVLQLDNIGNAKEIELSQDR